MKLLLQEDRFAICQLPAEAAIPRWAAQAPGVVATVRSREELSVVCREDVVPLDVRQERGWCALMVQGPLSLELTGVLASVANPLALAGISIFAISTFHTDYVLVKEDKMAAALTVLEAAGHTIQRE
jgi:hypothetical protein